MTPEVKTIPAIAPLRGIFDIGRNPSDPLVRVINNTRNPDPYNLKGRDLSERLRQTAKENHLRDKLKDLSDEVPTNTSSPRKIVPIEERIDKYDDLMSMDKPGSLSDKRIGHVRSQLLSGVIGSAIALGYQGYSYLSAIANDTDKAFSTEGLWAAGIGMALTLFNLAYDYISARRTNKKDNENDTITLTETSKSNQILGHTISLISSFGILAGSMFGTTANAVSLLSSVLKVAYNRLSKKIAVKNEDMKDLKEAIEHRSSYLMEQGSFSNRRMISAAGASAAGFMLISQVAPPTTNKGEIFRFIFTAAAGLATLYGPDLIKNFSGSRNIRQRIIEMNPREKDDEQ